MDLSFLPEEKLIALQKGDMSVLSEDELTRIAGQKPPVADRSGFSPSTNVLPGVQGKGFLPALNRGIYAAAAGAGRSLPGSDALPALISTEIANTGKRLHGDNPTLGETIREFKKQYGITKKEGDKIEALSSVGDLLGKIAGGVTTFNAANAALPESAATAIPRIHQIAKTALANIVSGQSQDVNPSRIPLQAAVGAGSELMNQGAQGLGDMIDSGGKKLMSTVIKTPLALAKKGKDLASKAYAIGLRGGYSNMANQLDTGENALEQQIQHELTNATGTIDRGAVANQAKKATSFFDVPGGRDQMAKAHSVVDEFTGSPSVDVSGAPTNTMTAPEANTLKRAIGKLLGKNFYKGDMSAIAPGTKEGQEALRSSLQSSIENVAPQVKPLNRQVGDMIELKDAVNTGAAKAMNWKSPGLGKIIGSLGLGSASGFGHGDEGFSYDPKRAAAVAAGLLGATYLMDNPAVVSTGAQAMKSLAGGVRSAGPSARLIGPAINSILKKPVSQDGNTAPKGPTRPDEGISPLED